MTDPNLADRHSGYSAEPPYSEVKVQIKQTYQYSRDRKNWTDLTTLTITRTITRTPQGGWEQRITTSLSQKTAVISLPADGFYNTP